MRLRVLAIAAIVISTLAGVGACGSSAPVDSAHSQGGTLVIGMINPFSGPNAEL